MSGGVWIHRIEACGGAERAIERASSLNADRIIVKCRDGRGQYNADQVGELAERANEAGIPLWVWAWCYSTDSGGSPAYCADQGAAIANDANELGAAGIVLNCEAPFSWSKFHRWGSLHEQTYGDKAARKRAMKERARELLLSVREVACCHRLLAVSTFPLPSQHALPFDLFAHGADLVMPQVYFSGMGYRAKVRKSIAQWEALGAFSLRFSGPGWRGPTKMRAMCGAVRAESGAYAPIDWWVLDKMEDAEIEAARALAIEVSCC